MAASGLPLDIEREVQKTPAERIQELNTINEQVPQILQAAGQAIQALTNASLPPSSSSNLFPPTSSSASTLSTHKTAFQSSTHTFFTLVTAIANQLHTQAYALETAGIIPAKEHRPQREPNAADLAEISKFTGGGAGAESHMTTDSEASTTNGGLGELDVGWLNARASDVGKGMEEEVLGRVKRVLEAMVGEENVQDEDDADENMQDA
ncbi:hypothetical protein AOQ84DRAFT_369918 [Glonium stellatum]|uniref:Mediator of RNA polymerase II transcription subunit 11 n=1 Tax=Glonium stellatum TaxID=574774 RepID=A0A8E2END6_9PEZI|nr:hypothetical protein AOQ84DRAFT_369918 [Glonium stellatum]